jgi:hypothetical protein
LHDIGCSFHLDLDIPALQMSSVMDAIAPKMERLKLPTRHTLCLLPFLAGSFSRLNMRRGCAQVLTVFFGFLEYRRWLYERVTPELWQYAGQTLEVLLRSRGLRDNPVCRQCP